ncbi:MAG: hypothetical protein ABIJ72_04400 [bacterium]
MKNNNTQQLEEDIFDFILFSQALCKKAKDIFDLMKSNQPNEIKEKMEYINDSNVHLLQLTGNLFMNQCVIELGGLLDKDSRCKTLKELIKAKNLGSSETDLDRIIKHFEDKNLLDIRNKFIAHRDKNTTGGPTSIIFSTYKSEIISNCESIIDEIIEFWVKYIGARPGNNMFLDKLENIDESVELLLNNTKAQIKK